MPAMTEKHLEDGKEEVGQEEEGADGDWVNEDLLQDVLCGGTLQKLELQRAVAPGENYLSILYRTRVEFRPPGSEDVVVKNVIVKGFPEGEYMKAMIQESGLFERELTMYEEVLPKLYAIAKSRLGQKPPPEFSAKAYKSARPDVLILEDLRPQGFVMANRRDRLDLTHCKLVVQKIAQFHALSLAFDEVHPNYITQFDDRMFSESNRERMNQYLPDNIRRIGEEVEQWEGFSEIAKKLKAHQSKAVDALANVTKVVEGGRNVLIHGDCWVNNILFKYSESGEPLDVRFVDFQLTRAASPALELNYFLFSSARTSTRERHFDDLLHHYCEEFGRSALDLGYKGPLITFEEIRKEIERTLYFGFTAVITTMALVLAEEGESPDLSTVTEEQMEKGEFNAFDKVYKNEAFIESFKSLLPLFDSHGIFD